MRGYPQVVVADNLAPGLKLSPCGAIEFTGLRWKLHSAPSLPVRLVALSLSSTLRVPPWTYAPQPLVIALYHLHRCPAYSSRPAGRTRGSLDAVEQPSMAPEARDCSHFLGLPGRVIYVAPAPPILHQEIRGRA